MAIAADVSKWVGEILLEDMPGHVAVDIVEVSVARIDTGSRDFAMGTFSWHITLRHIYGETFHTIVPQSGVQLLGKDAVRASVVRLFSLIAQYLRERDNKRRLLTNP